MIVNREYYVPHSLDNPMRIIIWTIDEALVIFFPVIVGLWIDAMASSLFVSAGLYMTLRKVKKQHDAYLLVKILYWYCPPVILLKKTPPSFRRIFIK